MELDGGDVEHGDEVGSGDAVDEIVERMIAGELPMEEVPAELRPAAAILAAAAAPALPHELAGEDKAIAAFRLERIAAASKAGDGKDGSGEVDAVIDLTDRKRRRNTVAAVVALAFMGVSGVAAAGGHLPEPAQRVVHDTLDLVGIVVPDAAPGTTTTTTTTTTTSTPGAAAEGAGGGAGETNHGQDVRTEATDRSTTGAEHGAAVCDVASEGRCKPDQTPGTDQGSNDEATDPSAQGQGQGNHGGQSGDRPEHPSMPDNSATPANPNGSGSPATPATPADPNPGNGNPATPATPAVPNDKGIPATPATPGGSSGKGTPATPAVPGSPGTPATPATPGGSGKGGGSGN